MYKLFISTLILTSLYSNTINFDEALKQTLKNNKSLKAKKLSIENSKLDVKQANSYNYGTLTFNENIARSNGALNVFGMKLMSREADFGAFGFSEFDNTNPNILTVQPNDLNNPDARNNFETKLVYEVPLFTGFKLKNAKEMASLQVLANKAKYTFDKKQLGLEVLKAYNGAVAAKYFIDATKDAKTATKSFVNFASEMFKEGYVTSIDVKQAKVYDMKINSMLLESKNKYHLAIAYLKFLTSNKDITDVADFQNIKTDKIDINVANRDDYKWMRYNTQTMHKKINLEKSANYPTIGAHLEYGFNDNQLNNLNTKKDYYTLAIGLEYKLFDGFAKNNNIQMAKIKYNQIKHNLDYMKEGIKLQIEKATLTLKTKKAILNEKIKAQNLANEVLIQSDEMYKNQLLKMSDLLMQQASFQKARAEVIMAKYDLSIASANLRLALGLKIYDQNQKTELIKKELDNKKVILNENNTTDVITDNDNNISIDDINKDTNTSVNIIKDINKETTKNITDNNISIDDINKDTNTSVNIKNIINTNQLYIVTVNIANIREGNTTNSKVLKRFIKNNKLYINTCRNKWCKLKNINGYIFKDSIKKVK